LGGEYISNVEGMKTQTFTIYSLVYSSDSLGELKMKWVMSQMAGLMWRHGNWDDTLWSVVEGNCSTRA